MAWPVPEEVRKNHIKTGAGEDGVMLASAWAKSSKFSLWLLGHVEEFRFCFGAVSVLLRDVLVWDLCYSLHLYYPSLTGQISCIFGKGCFVW